MPESSSRTVCLRPELFEEKRLQSGQSIEELAAKSGYDVKTVRRAADGLPIYLSTATAVATAMGTTVSELLGRTTPQAAAITVFEMQTAFIGVIKDPEQMTRLMALCAEIAGKLRAQGLDVTSHVSQSSSHALGNETPRVLIRIAPNAEQLSNFANSLSAMSMQLRTAATELHARSAPWQYWVVVSEKISELYASLEAELIEPGFERDAIGGCILSGFGTVDHMAISREFFAILAEKPAGQ